MNRLLSPKPEASNWLTGVLTLSATADLIRRGGPRSVADGMCSVQAVVGYPVCRSVFSTKPMSRTRGPRPAYDSLQDHALEALQGG